MLPPLRAPSHLLNGIPSDPWARGLSSVGAPGEGPRTASGSRYVYFPLYGSFSPRLSSSKNHTALPKVLPFKMSKKL